MATVDPITNVPPISPTDAASLPTGGMAPQGVNSPFYVKGAATGQAGSLDPVYSPSAVSATGLGGNPTSVTVPNYTPPASGSLDDILAAGTNQTPEEKSIQDNQNIILGNIKGLTDFEGTKSAEQIRLEATQGLPAKNAQLLELNGQIDQLTKDANDAKNLSENRLAPTFNIYGEQAAIDRQLSARTFGLAAAAKALTGEISLANDYVTKAIAAEFDPVKSALDYQQTLLTVNRDQMTEAEKKQADALSANLADRKAQIDQQASDKKDVYNVLLEAAKNGASNTTLNSINTAKTGTEAIKIAGPALKAKPTEIEKTAASEGQDLADAKTFLTTHTDAASQTAARQAFLQHHPSSAAAWDSYFGLSTNDQQGNYPAAPTAKKSGLFGWGFLGL